MKFGTCKQNWDFLGHFREPGPNWDQVPNLRPHCKHWINPFILLDNTMIWVQAHRLQTDIYYSGKKQHDDIGPHFRTNRQDASSSFIFFCLDRPSLVWSWWLSNFLRKLSPGIAMLGHTFPGWILMINKLFKKIVSWDCPRAFGSWTPCGRLGEEVLSRIVNNCQ